MNKEEYKITILGSGTSSGVPMIACKCEVCTSQNPKDKRLRSAVLVQTKNKNIVIDTGPDFRIQMLTADVTHLEDVLITHYHKDHLAGLDDVRAFNMINKSPTTVYAEENVISVITIEYSYAFSDIKFTSLPQIELQTIDTEPFFIDNIEIIPIRLMHHKLPILGYRIGNFAYLTDTNYIPESEFPKLKNLKVLVIDALRKKEHISHFNLEQVIEVIEKIAPKKAYLTHISHQMGLHDVVNSELPDNIELAYDGLQFIV